MDVSTSRDLCKVLIETQCPVLVEFSYYAEHPMDQRVGIVLYVGMMPSYRAVMTPELLTQAGLGKLFESDDVVKIVSRLDTQSCTAAIQLMFTNNIIIRNVFDINFAAKALDFVNYGQNWFQQSSFTSSNLMKFLGVPLDMKLSHHYRHYIAYLGNHLLTFYYSNLGEFIDPSESNFNIF